MTEDHLLQVNKPGRYIGQEWNVSKKDFDKSNIKFALAFPDLYEVGMSNVGIRIIYSILNSIPDICCERFFSPAVDMEDIIRKKSVGILSLESKRRLAEFDIIGFSLGYELVYTNVLNILSLGKIPLISSLRDHTHPLVIGGGPSVLNPEPMHEFFDLFVIGEAEEAILEIVDLYRREKNKFRTSLISKQDLLVMLSHIEGVYVPSLYEVRYDPQGKIEEFKPKIEGLPSKIRKRFVKDLGKINFPVDWLVPYIQIVHDRIALEIMRGCPNRCNFCQARSQYYPFRQRGPEDVLELSRQIYKRTGYEEISLSGLSVSDYPSIAELLKSLLDMFKKYGVSVSLPSIKPKMLVGALSSLIARVKKTGLTFAPEAATEKLRRILNKHFDDLEFFKVMEEAYSSGYQHVKLYFMIGLPHEEDQDLDAIIELADNISKLRKKFAHSAAQVNISINTLIPKPHTPFQWLGMGSIESIKSKQDYLKRKNRNNKLKLSFHNRYMSFLEGVLSRGDRRLSQVIMGAFAKGAKFDAWDDYFAFDKWLDAFAECSLSPDFYLREKKEGEILPWDFLDLGISKEVLSLEFSKVSQATTTT